MVEDDAPLYALRTPLAVADAVERLRALGPMAAGHSAHRSVRAVEVALHPDPFAPALGLTVEDRPAGAFVTARCIDSAFLRDFMRLVKAGLSVSGLVAVVFACTQFDGRPLGAALAGTAVGWVGLYGLVSYVHQVIAEVHATQRSDSRLRHQLASLLVRPAARR